jgi:hypothetical protein
MHEEGKIKEKRDGYPEVEACERNIRRSDRVAKLIKLLVCWIISNTLKIRPVNGVSTTSGSHNGRYPLDLFQSPFKKDPSSSVFRVSSQRQLIIPAITMKATTVERVRDVSHDNHSHGETNRIASS